MRGFSESEEFVTLTRQTKSDQCERVKANWQTAATESTQTTCGKRPRGCSQSDLVHSNGTWRLLLDARRLMLRASDGKTFVHD